MSDDTYPFQYVDENGIASGLLVDFWQQWARLNKQKVVFRPAHWKQSLDSVEQSTADIHIGMARTASRLKIFDFSEPLSKVNGYLYINKALTDINTLEKLIPYKIGVVMGSAHVEVLLAKQPKLTFSYYANRKELLDAVVNNEVFIFAGLEGYLRESHISQEVIMSFPFSHRIAISEFAFYPAVKKGNLAFLEKVMRGFNLVKPDEFNKIEQDWSGIQRSQNEVVVAMQTGRAPYSDIGPNGLPHGLLIDIWKLWSDKVGLPIRFIPGSMKQGVANVQKGVADVQLGYPESGSIVPELNRAHLIYQVSSRLFSYKVPFKTKDELKGKVFAVAPTSPYLPELIEALPDADFYYMANVQQMIEATESGKVDGFVAEAAWTQHYLLLKNRWEDFYQYNPIDFKTDLYVLNRSNDLDFSDRISQGFSAIKSTELAAIERKWILNPKNRIYSAAKKIVQLNSKQRAMIKSMGEIKVGFVNHWAPMEYKSDKGAFAGINSEIFKIISQEIGLNFSYVEFSDWQTLLDALLLGNIDMSGSIAPTDQRQAELVFTGSYWPAQWG